MRRLVLASGLLILGAACSSPATPPAASTSAAAPAPSSTPGAPAGELGATPPATVSSAPGAAGTPTPAASAATPARPVATSAGRLPPATGAPGPAAPPAASAPAPPSNVAAPAVPEYRELTVPAGTRLSIELRTALATDTSQVEDRVRGVLRQPLTVDGTEVVPAGAAVVGSVIESDRAGKVKGRAHLALRFTSITIDDADLRLDSERIARDADATKKDDAAKIGIGAGAGAIVGAITGGRKGAVVGGAIGAGAGTGVVLATRGDEVRLDAGTVLTTTLREPLVVRRRLP